MSHHFDTPTAKEDPRINLCDFYLFRGAPGTVVMALTVNPDAGGSAPDTFRDEGLYAFRFDLNGDAREELTFKVRFGEVSHAEGEGHRHVQTFKVRKATGDSALSGVEGELMVSGQTGHSITTPSGIRAFAGLAPELFVGNAAGVGAFRKAFYEEGRFAPEAFDNAKDFFHGKNVTAIVLEIPIELIGGGDVRAWATVSLYGHAPEVQVSRWGLPLITHIFLPDAELKEAYNRAVPSDDLPRFSSQIGHVVEKVTTLAKSVQNPGDYATRFVARFCPSTLPYTLGSDAAFTTEKFNGRALTDDVVDVILSLMTNTHLGDGVSSAAGRITNKFPYFGKPYGS
jgi:hypothetical protein